MLIKKPQINIISREVTCASGEVVLAFFAIREINGVREIKFLGTKPIEIKAEQEILFLENVKSQIFGALSIPSIFEAVSPFYTLDFLVNQLARAPSFK